MPFELLAVSHENLASILEKAGAKLGHRIIRSNKAMLATAKHLRTQIQIHSDSVNLIVTGNGIRPFGISTTIEFDFYYHFDEIRMIFAEIHDGEDFKRSTPGLYKLSCRRLQFGNTAFPPELFNALQDVISSKIKPEIIMFSHCSLVPPAEWKTPTPLIVYSDGISDMVQPFWFMRNCPETPYMVFDLASWSPTLTSIAILSQVIQKWRDGGLVSGRKWLRIRLFRFDDNAEFTPELVKELFASLWTDFKPEDVTEQLRVETEIAVPPLVKLKIKKSPHSNQSIHVLFSDVEDTTMYFCHSEKLQIDLIPNYDSGFDYAFPAEK